MDTTAPPLTAARREALLVFATHDLARASNVTDRARGLVYWQTGRWLWDEGLVVLCDTIVSQTYYRLTERGRVVLADVQRRSR